LLKAYGFFSMRILSRYILKEVSSHSLLGLLVFTFLLYFPYLNRLLEIVVQRNMSLSSLLVLFLLPIPGVLVVTIPIATLLGVLIGLSRMAADGEVIAARAGGVNVGQFVRPVILYGTLGCAVAMTMSMVFAPAAAWKLMRMENELKSTQLPYEIKPRVFIEQFPKLLLYLKDTNPSGSQWKGVFVANTSQPKSPEVTLAQTGYLATEPGGRGYTLHLEHGATQKMEPGNSRAYSVISFSSTDINIPMGQASATTPRIRPAPTQTVPQLMRYIQNPRYRHDGLVELNYRLALPVAALALAWMGLPLGLFTRKGGKAVGVMLAILLVFIYYVIMALGRELALQGRLNPDIGLWAANAIFAVGGFVMMRRMRRIRGQSLWIQHVWQATCRMFEFRRIPGYHKAKLKPQDAFLTPRKVGGRILQILDIYIVGQWLFYVVVTEIALTGIYIIFDFFQLLNDIVRNHVTAGTVLSYYGYLLPQITYLVLPLSVLVATLVILSLLTKSSQTVAMRSAGISLYRIALPVALAALAASGLMFAMNDRYLPAANQKQVALRNEIQGRPAQTFFRSGWQWIFGRSNRIYNYRFFDPDHNVFADLSVFDFDSAFKMTQRIYAQRAFWEPHVHQWILENGWTREFDGDRVTQYRPFSVAAFPGLTEEPSYFETEVRTSEQMSILELRHYIQELRHSGFDVVRLTVQFYRKFSYPLVALVVVLIGIPFGFTVGRKGALSGIALSLGIAVAFWSVSSLFQAMGNLNQLPPALAAWTPDVLFGVGGAYLLVRIRT
jgi:LPS export ABC transporter permease LptG/LPS export ABC transporter permease LptF